MKKYAILILGLLVMTTIVAAPGKEPSHPLSHIHPIDEDFNMSEMRIFNASRVAVTGGLKLDGNQILDSGAVPILNYNDDDRRLELRNNDFGVTGNNITAANNISFNDSLRVWGGKVWIPEDSKYGYFYRKNLSEVLEDGNNATIYDINMNGNDIENLDELRTDGSGSDDIAVRDTANGQDIARFKEGGEIEVPGGNMVFNDPSGRSGTIYMDGRRFTIANDANKVGVTLDSKGEPAIISQDGNGANALIVEEDSGGEIARFVGGNPGEVKLNDANLDVSGNNITNIDWLKFEEGTSIDGNITVNGSVNSSGNIDMNDNDILDANKVEANRIYDPEDGAIVVGDNIDLNSHIVNNVNAVQGNSGQDVDLRDGEIALRDTSNDDILVAKDNGNITVKNGDVNLTGNDLNVVRSIEGSSGLELSTNARGKSVVVEGARNGPALLVKDKFEDKDVLRAQGAKFGYDVEIPNGELDMTNNRISDVDSLSGTSGENLALTVSGTGSAELILDSSGNVVVNNNNLDLQGNRIVDTTGSDTVYVGDADSNTVQIQAGGSGDVALNTGDGGSGSTRRVTVTSSGGEADVDVQNSDVDLNGNSVTTSTGEVCIGDQCA